MRFQKLAIFGSLAITSVTLLVVADVLAYPSQFPLGLTVVDPGRVQSGVVIQSGVGNPSAIGLGGATLKTWESPIPDSALGYTRPLRNACGSASHQCGQS